MAVLQQAMKLRSNDLYSGGASGLTTAWYKIEFDGPFDVAQWIISSKVASGTPGTYKVQMAVTDQILVNSINNAFVPMRAGVAYNDTSANGWKNATFDGGAATKTIGLAPSAGNNSAISIITDQLALQSIARADGKPGGILLVKVVQLTTGAGYTTDGSTMAIWDTARGAQPWYREWFCTRRDNVDGIATLTTLPTSVAESTTGYSVMGCPVVTLTTDTKPTDLIMFTGDSRKSAAFSSFAFNNPNRMSAMSLSSAAHPISMVNAAGSGHSQAQYLAVALDLLNAGIRPTVIFLPGFSQNGFSNFANFKAANDSFMASARAISGLANVKFILDTDYYVSGYAGGAPETGRQQCIAYAKSLANGTTVFCFDSDVIITDYTNPSVPTFKSTYYNASATTPTFINGDGIHAGFGVGGQDAMSYGDGTNPGLQPTYRTALGIPAPDTTAPILTSPSATTTGTTTAIGSVTTNEATGTLYSVATVNATESAATVQAGASKAITSIGAQSVLFTGLTASMVYYPHYVHVDGPGNVSLVSDGPAFTTQALPSTVTAVVVTPATIDIVGGGTVDFDWIIQGANNPSQAATVSTTLGTINSAGIVTAPPSTSAIQTGTVTVTSTQDPTKSGTGKFNVLAAVLPPPMPTAAPILALYAPMLGTATVTGALV